MAGRTVLKNGALPRLGLMCGTFDPPHIGHLLLAHTAVAQLGLAQVLFLPVGQPTHKTTLTSAAHRRAMTEAAIADNPHFALDMTDMVRPAPHYTATLLPLLHDNYPDHELWLLLGEDAWRGLPTWHAPEAVVAQARLAVLPRPVREPSPAPVTLDVPGVWPVVWLDGPAIYLSSTMLRARLGAGLDGRYLLPTAVLTYIRTHQLYQTTGGQTLV